MYSCSIHVIKFSTRVYIVPRYSTKFRIMFMFYRYLGTAVLLNLVAGRSGAFLAIHKIVLSTRV
jgi:hypothetical protein